MNSAEDNVDDLHAVESDNSQIDIGSTNNSDVQRLSASENATFCDQDFDDDGYNEESDEDWADGANDGEENDGNSSSDESESSNYELITPAGIPEEDDNEGFEYRK